MLHEICPSKQEIVYESGGRFAALEILAKGKKTTQAKKKHEEKTHHERVPGHGGEELIEPIGEAQLVDDPVVAVAVDDRLVEVEEHHDVSHSSQSTMHEKITERVLGGLFLIFPSEQERFLRVEETREGMRGERGYL